MYTKTGVSQKRHVTCSQNEPSQPGRAVPQAPSTVTKDEPGRPRRLVDSFVSLQCDANATGSRSVLFTERVRLRKNHMKERDLPMRKMGDGQCRLLACHATDYVFHTNGSVEIYRGRQVQNKMPFSGCFDPMHFLSTRIVL